MTILATIINWDALGQVALVSTVVGIAVTLSMSLSVVTMLKAGDLEAESSGRAVAYRAVSVVFAAITVGILLLGIYEIAS
jgi:hypothetical protein